MSLVSSAVDRVQDTMDRTIPPAEGPLLLYNDVMDDAQAARSNLRVDVLSKPYLANIDDVTHVVYPTEKLAPLVTEASVIDSLREHFPCISNISPETWQSGLVLAGGSVARAMHGKLSRYTVSDMDLFMYNAFDAGTVVERLDRLFSELKPAYVVIRDGMATAHFLTTRTADDYNPIQVMWSDALTVSDIFDTFDIDESCVAFNGEHVLLHPRALRAMRTGISVLHESRATPLYAKRIEKYRLVSGNALAMPVPNGISLDELESTYPFDVKSTAYRVFKPTTGPAGDHIDGLTLVVSPFRQVRKPRFRTFTVRARNQNKQELTPVGGYGAREYMVSRALRIMALKASMSSFYYGMCAHAIRPSAGTDDDDHAKGVLWLSPEPHGIRVNGNLVIMSDGAYAEHIVAMMDKNWSRNVRLGKLMPSVACIEMDESTRQAYWNRNVNEGLKANLKTAVEAEIVRARRPLSVLATKHCTPKERKAFFGRAGVRHGEDGTFSPV